MSKEDAENGRDDMLIDASVPEDAIPDGFSVNYLRVYYGKCSFDISYLFFHFSFLIAMNQ